MCPPPGAPATATAGACEAEGSPGRRRLVHRGGQCFWPPALVCVWELASWDSLLLLCLPALLTWCPELNTQAWALSSRLDPTDVDVTTTTLTCTPYVQRGFGGCFGVPLYHLRISGEGSPLFWASLGPSSTPSWISPVSFPCPKVHKQGFCCWEREGTTRDWVWKREGDRETGAQRPTAQTLQSNSGKRCHSSSRGH